MSNDRLITDELCATLERDDSIDVPRRWPSQSDMAR